ncbi:hypothetical protein HO173_007707 [Letharia columbiana]|uniref:Major facilitator superfamily (MFS) profile domain-containing protein n=1 Tax=Letharia columbiana TaxID=112416 RepID=A0A8H6L3N5_9LECA|nr:uncharacterized protein HO173_007707 [Letharia columbiana]KAF6234285.1 hypothetical protein HO173_007707 [Letharia columbiana]
MDNDTGKIAAQEIDRESPKEHVGPDLEEKIENGSSPDGSLHKTEHGAEVSGTKEKDVEMVETEIQDPEPVKVPRSQRRGLFGRFSILAEVEEPKHYPRRTKWYITFVVALAAVAAPMGSAIIFPSLLQISDDLHTSPTITNLSAALYMLSMSIFPLWWSSFSETLGRRTIYLTSFTLFLLFNILSAVSKDIAMLIIMRVLGGGAAASVQAVGAGTIADVWEVRERGRAMGIFYLGPLCGPLFAPIIGGALAEKFGWRSTQWFLAIYGGAVLVFLFFALPETLKATKSPSSETEKDLASDGPNLARTTSRQSVQRKTAKHIKTAKRIFLDPLKIILYLRFPAVLITVYYASITFGSLYLLNVSLQTTFSKPPYNFSTTLVGLTYIPNSIGYVLASLFGGKWTDKIMAREAKRAGRYDEKGKLMYRPEDRMRENAWIAAFLYPSALVWYGWTAEKGIFWLVPLVANFFFGIGSMLIFAMATTMLTEFMPKKASNGVAVNNFVRNIFSCVGAIVAQPLISAIGNGWLFTGVGVIATASSAVIWAMRRFGPRWRQVMDRELNQAG